MTFSRIGTDGYPSAPFLEPYVILSHHTARAIYNPAAQGASHREKFIPVSALILPELLAFLEILRVDVGIRPVPGLHVTFHLHIAWSEQLALVLSSFRYLSKPKGFGCSHQRYTLSIPRYPGQSTNGDVPNQ